MSFSQGQWQWLLDGLDIEEMKAHAPWIAKVSAKKQHMRNLARLMLVSLL